MEIKQIINRTISTSNVLILPHKDYTNFDIMLACPFKFNDDSNESHQEKVICYCRAEDERFIKRVEVDLYSGAISYTVIAAFKSENPSSRRQAVSIAMRPEYGDPFLLNVFQHKGNTYMNTS